MSPKGPVVRVAHSSGAAHADRIPLERYVMGVLSKEVLASWPLEALKAQAVASRTYVLYRLEHPRNQSYDVLSDTSDQVFSNQKKIDPAIRRAVQETEGEVLTYRGDIFESFFHSSCGGRSEKADRVWPGAHPQAVNELHEDPYCSASPNYNWALSLSKRELPSPEVSLHRDAITGRVASVSFLGKDKKSVQSTMSSAQFRNMIGPLRLRSTLFEVAGETADEISFKGHGSGHGVGLCQWGAKGMADRGIAYRDILSFYYPGSEIRTKDGPINPEPVSPDFPASPTSPTSPTSEDMPEDTGTDMEQLLKNLEPHSGS